jgi:hypothetical protein
VPPRPWSTAVPAGRSRRRRSHLLDHPGAADFARVAAQPARRDAEFACRQRDRLHISDSAGYRLGCLVGCPPAGCDSGKRFLRLQVVDRRTEALPSARQALVRNLVKITLPWELGYTVALATPTSRQCCASTP